MSVQLTLLFFLLSPHLPSLHLSPLSSLMCDTTEKERNPLAIVVAAADVSPRRLHHRIPVTTTVVHENTADKAPIVVIDAGASTAVSGRHRRGGRLRSASPRRSTPVSLAAAVSGCRRRRRQRRRRLPELLALAQPRVPEVLDLVI